jgi:hypothetical protein
MRLTAVYSLLAHRRNKNILEEFKVGPTEEKLIQYKQM